MNCLISIRQTLGSHPVPALVLLGFFAHGCINPYVSSPTPPSGERPGIVTPDLQYRISPNDFLAISVMGEPELDVKRSVTSNGMITLPMIEEVEVVGNTPREAEEAIAQEYLDQEFFQNPQVSVTIEKFSEKTVSVLGYVHKPGLVPIPAGYMRIKFLEAIAQAGDFKPIANLKKVKITRNRESSSVGDTPVKDTMVNVDDWRKNGYPNPPVYLYPGDVVRIKPKVF